MKAKTILIADDDGDLAESLELRCRSMGLEVERVGDAMSALAYIGCAHPDVVCLDICMPPGNGLAVAELMADGGEKLARIPVIFMTAVEDDKTIDRARALGTRVVRKRDGFWQQLEQAIRETLAQDDGKPERTDDPQSASEPAGEVWDLCVLAIDDDAEFSWGLQKRLEKHGISVIRAFEGMQGYRTAFLNQVDAIICDYSMPDGNGDYILRRLKENPITKDVPVIVLTGRKDRALERKLTNLGAVRFLTKPYKFGDLLGELRRHAKPRSAPANDPVSRN